MSYRDLPSLKSIVSFVVVAEEGSVSRAAELLFVTHSAISQNIKLLESLLGRPLFLRESRKMILTHEGKRFYTQVFPALAAIESAVSEQQQDNKSLLTINLINSLAIQWLAPRLVDFKNKYSEIDVRLSTLSDKWDFKRDGIDASIVYGRRDSFSDCECSFLFPSELVMVGLPSLSHSCENLQQLIYQHSAIYIEHESRKNDWSIWSKYNGVSEPGLKNRISFSNSALGLRAVMSGLGVMVTQYHFVQDELNAGNLVMSGNCCKISGLAYYLVYPKSSAANNKILSWREWLLTQV